ncbi:thermonuclease family protein [Xanthobacter aminoxidans]|uniref:thermonuclease family protein n=1 Tax=Xanthobacter aminoxidans TaxID=186280 RepID=UPI002022DE53|nr:thermonuclease family protein [Xanthobacter aminoxidans]MCL8385809.1 thermonuclease family protein [Xanthobacter aminoxidans]
MKFPSDYERARDALIVAGLAVLGVFLIFVILLAQARGEPIAPSAIHVIDGDTIAVGPAHYRLVGFDTPEAGDRARCPAERMLSALATRRLQQIVDAGSLDLQEVDCRCRPGTAGTKRCNHGRLCGQLTANGHDVGDTLLAEGYAQPYHYDPDAPRPPASWCGRE